MMLELVMAYLFAAGTGATLVYLARQNRKQGWRRPAPQWFGVELGGRTVETPVTLEMEPESDPLLPQLLQLNRELAAHGSPVAPQVHKEAETETVEAQEHVLIRRV